MNCLCIVSGIIQSMKGTKTWQNKIVVTNDRITANFLVSQSNFKNCPVNIRISITFVLNDKAAQPLDFAPSLSDLSLMISRIW